MEQIKKRKHIIISIAVIIVVFLMYLFLPRNNDYKRKNIVIILNKEYLFEKINVSTTSIELSNCKEYLIDYDEHKNKILYMDNQGKVLEFIVDTGEIRKLNFPNFHENIYNLKYGPDENDISYTYNDNLYVYNFIDKETRRITDCQTSTLNSYEWINNQELYYIKNVGEKKLKMLTFRNTENKDFFITSRIKNFTLSSSGNIIYAIKEKSKFNGITIETNYELVEINKLKNTSKKLFNINTEGNLILKCIDDKYIFFIEEKFNTQLSTVYIYKVESGEKIKICRTYDKVIGIIVK